MQPSYESYAFNITTSLELNSTASKKEYGLDPPLRSTMTSNSWRASLSTVERYDNIENL